MKSFAHRLGATLFSSLLIYVPGVPVANAPVRTQSCSFRRRAPLNPKQPITSPASLSKRSAHAKRGSSCGSASSYNRVRWFRAGDARKQEAGSEKLDLAQVLIDDKHARVVP